MLHLKRYRHCAQSCDRRGPSGRRSTAVSGLEILEYSPTSRSLTKPHPDRYDAGLDKLLRMVQAPPERPVMTRSSQRPSGIRNGLGNLLLQMSGWSVKLSYFIGGLFGIAAVAALFLAAIGSGHGVVDPWGSGTHVSALTAAWKSAVGCIAAYLILFLLLPFVLRALAWLAFPQEARDYITEIGTAAETTWEAQLTAPVPKPSSGPDEQAASVARALEEERAARRRTEGDDA
jgi:hypothetical protein